MRILLLSVLLGTLGTSFAVRAEETRKVDQRTFRDVAGELRCPTCTGLSVLDSEAKFSVQIKNEVRSQLEQGVPKEKILDFFKQRYGPWILRKPPNEGFNAIVWWVPISLLIFGPVLIWFFVWRKRKVVSSFGVRSTEMIVAEMKLAVKELKSKNNKEGSC